MAKEDPCGQLIDHSHIPDFEVRLVVKISLTVIYGIIFLAGIVGNSVTIQTTKLLRDKGYLQKGVTDHMISLACSDLLVILLGMPVELYSVIWFPFSSSYGNITCKVYCFLFEACSYATIFHVATLSFERYMAICHPFRFKAVSGTWMVKLMICFAWLTSVCVALPLIFAMGAEYPLSPMSGRHSQCNTSTSFHMNGNFTLCTNLHSKWLAFQASIFSAFAVYIVVLVSVAFMCRRMMVILMVTKKGTITVKGQPGTSVTTEMTKSDCSEARSARKQTTVFLGLIVLTLTFCWMPNQVLRIMAASVPKQEWTVHYFRAYMTLLPVADTFFYLSSVVNPLLYNISSKQFRDVFLQVLRCHLTLEHVNVEKLRRAHLNSAASANYKRPLISMSFKRHSMATHQNSCQTSRKQPGQESRGVPMTSQQDHTAIMVQATSGRNGLCESEI
ncbi:G-protein coupled receptor 39 [Bufo gargarizans]|uniref:G-protein coupled receptor 39 n=1 Tax=Bufo gargarizans TaxID=30331 RepID=UPI001CF3954C|nr:G-protein coupled receptor 39 [Bufo gargarizans]